MTTTTPIAYAFKSRKYPSQTMVLCRACYVAAMSGTAFYGWTYQRPVATLGGFGCDANARCLSRSPIADR